MKALFSLEGRAMSKKQQSEVEEAIATIPKRGRNGDMSQLHLRLTIPDRGPGLTVSATCDYCGKLARVRMIGNDLVCDRCMGITAPADVETELEQCRR